MATKRANVMARVEPDLKEQAETILSTLGIPASTEINMFYRQIVLWNGMPFRPAVPTNKPLARDEMTDAELNARMATRSAQAKADQSAPAHEAFSRLIDEVANGNNSFIENMNNKTLQSAAKKPIPTERRAAHTIKSVLAGLMAVSLLQSLRKAFQ